MQTAGNVTEYVLGIKQLGPFVGLVLVTVLFIGLLLYYKIVPFLMEQARAREKFQQDLVNQNLARLDTATEKLPAALDRIASGFQAWGERTEKKLDALPEDIERRFIRVMDASRK